MSNSLHPALMSTAGVTHHSMVSRVESEQLTSQIRQDILSLNSTDKKIIQWRKEIQQLRTKLPEKLAAILVDSFNRDQRVAERLVSTITGFFGARTRALRRKLCDLMQPETIEEGQLNAVQMKIAQGDRSRPTLMEMKKEIGDYRAILDELEAAVDAELYPVSRQV